MADTDERPVTCTTRYVDDKIGAKFDLLSERIASTRDQLTSLEKLLDERVSSVRKEEDLHRRNLDTHLSALNNEADRLADFQGRTVSLDFYRGAHAILEVEMRTLNEKVARMTGNAEARASWAIYAAGGALFISLFDMVLRWAGR